MFGYNITEFLSYAEANEKSNEKIYSMIDDHVHKSEDEEEGSSFYHEEEYGDNKEEDESGEDEGKRFEKKKIHKKHSFWQ